MYWLYTYVWQLHLNGVSITAIGAGLSLPICLPGDGSSELEGKFFLNAASLCKV
ncbi:hypothetical protein [Alkalicoccus luteus]|uniref:Uncharacterized protein n=1 Tax=Alkalicoccus luteus TaxID=1237094 RepID=A0A969PRS7_9BACI|nr:hypothetical protein [Alkalicoccus luteus]NJP38355.1 hypothetical protein [Alkalicoccus luteus]